MTKSNESIIEMLKCASESLDSLNKIIKLFELYNTHIKISEDKLKELETIHELIHKVLKNTVESILLIDTKEN